MKFEITKEQLQEIGNYLYVKPMNEVEQLVGMIRNLKEIKEDVKLEVVKGEANE